MTRKRSSSPSMVGRLLQEAGSRAAREAAARAALAGVDPGGEKEIDALTAAIPRAKRPGVTVGVAAAKRRSRAKVSG